MAKTEMIRARMELDLKQEAESIFFTLGISPTKAITLFYKQVALHNGLPFEVKIPKSRVNKSSANTDTGDTLRQTVHSGD